MMIGFTTVTPILLVLGWRGGGGGGKGTGSAGSKIGQWQLVEE